MPLMNVHLLLVGLRDACEKRCLFKYLMMKDFLGNFQLSTYFGLIWSKYAQGNFNLHYICCFISTSPDQFFKPGMVNLFPSASCQIFLAKFLRDIEVPTATLIKIVDQNCLHFYLLQLKKRRVTYIIPSYWR